VAALEALEVVVLVQQEVQMEQMELTIQVAAAVGRAAQPVREMEGLVVPV
jgi:hypothetical protein